MLLPAIEDVDPPSTLVLDEDTDPPCDGPPELALPPRFRFLFGFFLETGGDALAGEEPLAVD